jgi:hypothetical protein
MSAKRNILIAAVAVIGGYVAYRAVRSRFASSGIEQDYAAPVAPAYKPGAIRADQVVTVRIGTPIMKKEKGMQYFPILSAKKVGMLTERSFRPNIDGFFTGRILTQSKREYAEVQPASSSLSGMGDLGNCIASVPAQINTLAGDRNAGMDGIREDYVLPALDSVRVLQDLAFAARGARSGGGSRRQISRQLVAARKNVRNTPEYKALRAQCQKEVDKLNEPYVAMNVGNWRYEANPDILTGGCRIQQENFEVAGGGD